MKEVKASLPIEVTPAMALNAFTEFESLNSWWGVGRCHVEKHLGGAYALAWGLSEKGFHYVSCGVVKRYEAGKLLEVGDFCYFNPEKEILTGLNLKVQVSPQNNGTLVQICQSGYRSRGDWDWYYDAVQSAWPQALQQLKSFLENK